jgi:Mannosylglycerate hydrolase MGH1-like glycoside hydrolase domain
MGVASPREFAGLTEAVAAIYQENRQVGVAPWCKQAYDFVCPSLGTYPFQWFWDSCFHATVLRHLDVGRAETELVSLLKNQDADGFIGHVTLWQRERYAHLLANYNIAYRTPYVSDCIQPPVLAEAVWDVARAGRGTPFVREMVAKVRAFYDWLHRVRDPDGDGLIALLLPDESGLDHIPKYDAYLGIAPGDETLAGFDAAWARVARAYESVGRDSAGMFALDVFIVEDVLLNSIYGRNERFLARLLAETGDHRAADEYNARAEHTTRSLLAKCYDPERGLFFDLAGAAERRLEVNTFTCLMPLLLPDLPTDIAGRLVGHLEDPDTFALPYPVPSVARTEPTFRPGPVSTRLTWRGPTWLNVNWLCTRGLRQHGRDDLADDLARRSVDLVKKSGFREYYDPLTGEGHGAKGFAWSALVLDMAAAIGSRSFRIEPQRP